MAYYLGLDVGGSYLKLGLLSEDFQLKGHLTAKTPTESKEELMSEITDLIFKLLSKEKIELEDITAFGVGIPGLVDNEKGLVVHTNNLPLTNFNFKNYLNQELAKRTFLANDANLALLAESKLGAGRGFKDIVLLTLGTGVGGGIMIGGKIHSGYNKAASELGHQTINFNGPRCGCGRKGCLEVYASVRALIRLTKEKIASDPTSYLAEIAAKTKKINGRTAFIAKARGDQAANLVIEEYINNLAEGISNLINILMPELIIIGGGISNEGAGFLEEVKEASLKLSYLPSNYPPPKFLLAQLKNEAGMVGAAIFAAAEILTR